MTFLNFSRKILYLWELLPQYKQFPSPLEKSKNVTIMAMKKAHTKKNKTKQKNPKILLPQ